MPELLQTVVVGMLTDHKLSVSMVSWHPAGVHIVSAGDAGLQHHPGSVHRHVLHAVVVEVVGGVDRGQVLV